MDNLLEQNVAIPSIEIKTIVKTKTNTLPLYLFSFVYFLIPILSVESIVCWSIGVVGIYKTVKLYRSNEENKTRKAIKLLIISLAIAAIFNILVYYVTKIIVAKVV